MHPKGLVKLTVDGKERFLKIGTLSSAIFCELEKINVADIGFRLQNAQPFTMIHFLYAGASAYRQLSKQDIDFSVADVSEWIDQMGEGELVTHIVESVSTYQGKKGASPSVPKKSLRGKTKR